MKKKKDSTTKDPRRRIILFSILCKEEPTFVCVICSRWLYQKELKKTPKKPEKNILWILKSKFLHLVIVICLSCDRDIQKVKKAAQALWNKLTIYPVPNTLSIINKLEKVLISRRIPFRKVTNMPKINFQYWKETYNIRIEIQIKLSWMFVLRLCDPIHYLRLKYIILLETK